MKPIVITSALSAGAAVVGGIGTDPQSLWYKSLAKPPWDPPGVVYPLVWTPVYGLIAWGTARMIEAEPDAQKRKELVALTGVNLAVNAGWCWAFFNRKSPAGGMVTILCLDVLNVGLLREAYRRDRLAAAALAPYVLWTAFASVLNGSIWRRNRGTLRHRLLRRVS